MGQPYFYKAEEVDATKRGEKGEGYIFLRFIDCHNQVGSFIIHFVKPNFLTRSTLKIFLLKS